MVFYVFRKSQTWRLILCHFLLKIFFSKRQPTSVSGHSRHEKVWKIVGNWKDWGKNSQRAPKLYPDSLFMCLHAADDGRHLTDLSASHTAEEITVRQVKLTREGEPNPRLTDRTTDRSSMRDWLVQRCLPSRLQPCARSGSPSRDIIVPPELHCSTGVGVIG